MQTPSPLLAASLAVLGTFAHPVWGQSRDGRRGEHRVRLALAGRRGSVLTRTRYVD